MGLTKQDFEEMAREVLWRKIKIILVCISLAFVAFMMGWYYGNRYHTKRTIEVLDMRIEEMEEVINAHSPEWQRKTLLMRKEYQLFKEIKE